MARVIEKPDIKQGFNFSKDVNVPCGMIKKLKIGDKELVADLEIKDVSSPEGYIKVVGVCATPFTWDGAQSDCLDMNFQVSNENRAYIRSLLLADMTKIDVTFQFCNYNYDPDAKQYYKSFHCNDSELVGNIKKVNGQLALEVDDEPSLAVQTPMNFPVNLKVEPTKKQDLHVWSSVTIKNALPWGNTIGA